MLGHLKFMIIMVIIHPYHQQRHHNHHSYLIITSVITNGNTIDISKIKIAIFITATQAFHIFCIANSVHVFGAS